MARRWASVSAGVKVWASGSPLELVWERALAKAMVRRSRWERVMARVSDLGRRLAPTWVWVRMFGLEERLWWARMWGPRSASTVVSKSAQQFAWEGV